MYADADAKKYVEDKRDLMNAEVIKLRVSVSKRAAFEDKSAIVLNEPVYSEVVVGI